MKSLKILLGVLIAAVLCIPLAAKERKSKTLDPATKAQIASLQQELAAANAKMYEAFRKIEKTEAIVALRKAYQDADRAYQKGKDTATELLDAKAAVRIADREYDALVLKKVKASPAGAALLKQKVALDNKRAACGLAIALAEVKLTHEDSPIVRAIEADPIIAQYKQAYYNASGDARDKARADYEKLRKATLEDMVAARTLLAEIKAAKADEDAAQKAMDEIDDKIDEMTAEARKSEDPGLKAARAKLTAAREGYEKAYYGGTMKVLRDKRETTKRAVRAGIQQVIAKDPALSALSARINQLYAEIKKLGGKPSRSARR